MKLTENVGGHASLVSLCLGLAAALCLLAACSSTSHDPVPDTRYQLGQAQPDALANPRAAPDTVAEPTGPFAHWAAVVVAGDNAASGGGTTQAFDNARKDVAKALVRAGFAEDHIAQFSSHPADDDPTRRALADVDAVRGELHRLLADAGAGCLIYVTSHGNVNGIMFGEKLASTSDIAGLADKTCGMRPTVMILSACHSGIFVQPLQAPNRLVLTAARSDRSSFGCGVSNKYPYFDQCMIESLPTTANFITLADRVKACVAHMEEAGHFAPPSEPQLSIGSAIEPTLAQDDFANAAPAATTVACAAATSTACHTRAAAAGAKKAATN